MRSGKRIKIDIGKFDLKIYKFVSNTFIEVIAIDNFNLDLPSFKKTLKNNINVYNIFIKIFWFDFKLKFHKWIRST